jgi:hypothetical protein
MFGNTKIKEDAVKSCSSLDCCLTTNVIKFEGQLDTCILFLKLMMCEKGVSSEGYRFLKGVMKNKFQTILNMFNSNPYTSVKLGYLADIVFQCFANRLTTYVDTTKPVTNTRDRLKGRQQDSFEDALGGLKVGIMPNIPLPDSLLNKGKSPAIIED